MVVTDMLKGRWPVLVFTVLYAIFVAPRLAPDRPPVAIKSMDNSVADKALSKPVMSPFHERCGYLIFFGVSVLLLFSAKLKIPAWEITLIGALLMVITGVLTPKEAVAAGADEIDCGVLGMARSAGNCATELAAATLKKEGYLPEVDLYKLLDYLERELIPAMAPYGYHVAVNPTDLMLGLAGCHSNYLPMFRKVAEEEHVALRRLIAEVSAVNRKNPDEALLRSVAAKLPKE